MNNFSHILNNLIFCFDANDLVNELNEIIGKALKL